jgi:hypothetical protein
VPFRFEKLVQAPAIWQWSRANLANSNYNWSVACPLPVSSSCCLLSVEIVGPPSKVDMIRMFQVQKSWTLEHDRLKDRISRSPLSPSLFSFFPGFCFGSFSIIPLCIQQSHLSLCICIRLWSRRLVVFWHYLTFSFLHLSLSLSLSLSSCPSPSLWFKLSPTLFDRLYLVDSCLHFCADLPLIYYHHNHKLKSNKHKTLESKWPLFFRFLHWNPFVRTFLAILFSLFSCKTLLFAWNCTVCNWK